MMIYKKPVAETAIFIELLIVNKIWILTPSKIAHTGVLNLGCMLENLRGNKPFRAIANAVLEIHKIKALAVAGNAKTMTILINNGPKPPKICSLARKTGVSEAPSSFQGTTPTDTNNNPIYNPMTIRIDEIIEIGIVLPGFWISSAEATIPSQPTIDKNPTKAAASIPSMPVGEKA